VLRPVNYYPLPYLRTPIILSRTNLRRTNYSLSPSCLTLDPRPPQTRPQAPTVETDDSRVVQFSHFSVKEFLTSDRLATSSRDVSRYHIVLGPAHTILAQASMSVLLLPPDHRVEQSEQNGTEKSSPLAGYAARHWVTHAQFENVSSFLRKAMEFFFDLDKPYFAAWIQLHDIDAPPDPLLSSLYLSTVFTRSGVTPLYYAALCGFQDLVEHLVMRYPQHVNASGGYYVTPLVAALAGRHFQIVKFLRHKGAHVDVRDEHLGTPLFSAAWNGDLEMVWVLLDYKADVNARNRFNWTPTHAVLQGSFYLRDSAPSNNIPQLQLLPAVARSLLEHGAEVNVRTRHGTTSLHIAANYGRVEVIRVLLEHGANVGAEDNDGRTPLHVATSWGSVNADYDTIDVGNGRAEVVRVLLEHGANVGAQDNEGRTPLHLMAVYGRVKMIGRVEIVRMLLEHGANAGAEDDGGRTPFQIASAEGDGEIMKLLS
jgi:ankyrin repeat protein